MSKKVKTLLKLLSSEKEKIEEKIHILVREKDVLGQSIKKAKVKKLLAGLKQEKEELEERIENLKKEKEDIVAHQQVVKIIGELQCPKGFQCYKSKYNELCKAGFNGKADILCCLEEEPKECLFS